MNRSTITAYKDNYNKANFYWSYPTPGTVSEADSVDSLTKLVPLKVFSLK